MSMKQEIETWVAALAHYDQSEFEEAVRAFAPIADTSKILFNVGVIRATLGEHEAAVMNFQQAVQLDRFLAIAYFQSGVSNFLVGDFEEALANFNDTLQYLRGNKYIDYEQLGLKFKLHACEVLFNRGLCYIYLRQDATGMQDLKYASSEKAKADHDVIDEAISHNALGYTVFSIPVGVVFRPNEAKVKNIQARNYLGNARLVAQAHDHSHRRNLSVDDWVSDDRPKDQISYAATHLVKPNLKSRSRLQSEPPVQRNVFPPTPPPDEMDKQLHVVPEPSPVSQNSRRRTSPDRAAQGARSSSLSRARVPEPLSLGAAAFSPSSQSRRGTTRSASERPAARAADRPPQESPHGAPTANGTTTQQSRHRNQSRQQQTRSISQQVLHEEETEEDGAAVVAARENLAAVPEYGDAVRVVREDDQRSSYHSQPPRSSSSRNGSTPIQHKHSSSNLGPTTKLRVKVHFAEDTRFIIVGTNVRLAELNEKVATKFASGGAVKIKTRDEEGDMITLGDQDDLDMALALCKTPGKTSHGDLTKLEVWAQAV